MPALMTIELRDLHFHAFHGLYPEERKAGNDFRVWLQVNYQPPEEVITAIEDTINYAALFDIVQKAMQSPVDLLETLVMEIADTIHVRFPQVIRISISIHKLHPPIARFTGEVGVKFEKEY
jgi:7,8-dihydroneopterin aldolase/epimerase/oxygenase